MALWLYRFLPVLPIPILRCERVVKRVLPPFMDFPDIAKIYPFLIVSFINPTFTVEIYRFSFFIISISFPVSDGFVIIVAFGFE